MLIVAENSSTVVIDKGTFWEIYDPSEKKIVESIVKEQYPQYLNALYAKWGYTRLNIEVRGYDEIEAE